MRRIGVLMSLAADDPEGQARLTAFAQGLQELGWTMGRNVQIDYRWAAGDTNRHRSHAAELVALAPDVILAVGSATALQSVAPSLGVDLRPVGVRDAGEIERAITAFARQSNGGLIVTAGAGVTFNRELIIKLAARHRLPAVYPFPYYVTSGGLMSYGPDTIDQFRRAAGYVDRILKGEKPADLPVQAPTKYHLMVKPQDGEGAWPRNSADSARPRRRGDRIIWPMSAFGT
jgi:ABC-type uncharacterized transport system substrate-binding protein